MEPAWTQFESAQQGKVNLVKINVDQKSTPEFKKYEAIISGVQAIPTTLWLDQNGKVIDSKVGGMSAEELTRQTEAAQKQGN